MAEGLIQIARAVREAVLAADGVYDLGKGRYVEAATYEGSEKVSGVVVGDNSVEVHIVLDYPLAKPIPEIDKELRSHLVSRSGGRAVELVFEDLVDEEERAARRAGDQRGNEQTSGTGRG